MIHRIEIRAKDGFGDPHAESIAHQISELGIDSVEQVASVRIFFIGGDFSEDAAGRIAVELLVDPVTEDFRIGVGDNRNDNGNGDGGGVIEVHLQPGVMDPVAASVQHAIRDMGIEIDSVRTGRRYELTGNVSESQRRAISTQLLANPVIEDVFTDAHVPDETHTRSYTLDVVTIPIRQLDGAGLEKLSKDGDLFLNLTEMRAIQDYFKRLNRDPRDVELEMIAQTWSEHCGHKTFRSDVEVRNDSGDVIERIPNLLKTTVFQSTMELDKPWCLNVFEDNAGVIEFDDENAVCFKAETHNHPSAIEPYGGSMTGIGGVVRDPMGTGLGARPIANTDVFCFGNPDMPLDEVPTGALHPRRVMRGVVSGVRDYGNRMGIPTVNGAIYFDDRYVGNPLVFCGTVAIMPKNKCRKKNPNPGDAIVCVGGRTGRDGIHGATFSSGEMTHEHGSEFSHAVQIGNAVTEKKVLDTILQARDAELFSCITDCGAGGLSSAVGEMGELIGAEVHLDRVPLKYDGLSYAEIWISEAQERMVLAVPQENVEKILALFAAEDVEATVIGHYGTENNKLQLFYDGTQVCELDMDFLHDVPRPVKQALWDPKAKATEAPPQQDDYKNSLLKILASPNVASKEWVIRQYDHEVQGASVIKPLVGATQDGPGDAAVVRPVYTSDKGVVISCGMNPTLGDLDPYQSTLHAVDEALRNLVAVGGNLERTAILDNFCWGNCNKPDRMGSLVQAAKAARHAALVYKTPFISGKDSLNNEFQTATGETIAIPPTLLISAISVIDDVNRCVTSDAKSAGNLLFIVGKTRPELGGAHYLKVENLPSGNDVPPVDCAMNFAIMQSVQRAIEAGLIKSCHDLSEGGLTVAAAEMGFAGGLGLEISLDNLPISTDGKDVSDIAKLFGESAGRFLIEVTPENKSAFEEIMCDVSCGQIGKITDSQRLVIDGFINVSNEECKSAWNKTFDW